MADQPKNEEAKARILQFRTRLSSISRVSFRSRSGPRSQCHWSGAGEGAVAVDVAADGSLVFTESGHFQLDASPAAANGDRPRPVPFRNVFRWRPDEDHVALCHERRGADAAVWLFDLVVAGEEDDADFVSREAHLCVDDRYRARLTLREGGFDLEWTIAGPKKDESLHYQYRSR